MLTEPRSTPAFQDLFRRIEGEFRERPGLTVTLPQAARLWGLDCTTCELALAALVERQVVRRATNGTYIRYSLDHF